MANNIAILNNIHNFYLSTYADKTNSPYDTHKKSELRGVYNSIVKINKDSPLYILDNTDEGRQYV
ncbi:MAG: flagellar capping protein, partial [Lachnospiraceae bacterium]|nr:flagellar capping protein [Lachnospiraceae bacterium]